MEAGVILNDSTGFNVIATLSIDNDMKIKIERIGKYIYRDEDYPTVGGFRYFHQIAADNVRVFWVLDDRGKYLLLIDKAESNLIDSLNISTELNYSNLFALSVDNSTIYVFYIDCFCKGWRTPTKLESTAPNFLKRYSTVDLSLIDSLCIPSPCTDSICLEYVSTSCERVGDYLVYFFMQTAHIEWYPPALLFIFDTRTNEANWLRVGWR